MDLYSVLGIDSTADNKQIKQAYRKLASKHHPDKGGDTATFQRIQSAYEILGDPERRAEYDNPPPTSSPFVFTANDFDLNQIFGAFNQNIAQGHSRRNLIRMTLWILLHDAVVGARRTVNLVTNNGVSAVEIEIPKGINDGDQVQYSGIAPGGHNLVIQFRVHPDAKWQRKDLNLITDHSVSVLDLIIGGTTKITDIYGTELELRVPAMTQPGTMLRLRGRGISNRNHQQGDLFVRITATIPDHVHPEVIAAIQRYHQ